ncbi:hypothetical protein JCM21900_000090 [Sporobolomyces salmonicolor]
MAEVMRSPLPLHLHESSLASALSTRFTPSPWSRFISPSLFSLEPGQRSTPLPAVASPFKDTVDNNHQEHQPGLFTHSKEINPFERSFSVVDPTAVAEGAAGTLRAKGPLGRDGSAAHPDGLNLQLLPNAPKRKRALSSPALFTPGGTGERIADFAAQAFKHAKRPSLRLSVDARGDAPIGGMLPSGLAGSSVSLVQSESTYSLDSSTSNSLRDDLNLSLQCDRLGRAHTATVSPDSSVALSPHSPKPLAVYPSSSLPATFTHYQAQPIPFFMPSLASDSAVAPVSLDHSIPFSHPSFETTTLAPATIGPAAVVPLPLDPTLSLPHTTHQQGLTFAPVEGGAFSFTDPFAIVPTQPEGYPAVPVFVPPSVTLPPPASTFALPPSDHSIPVSSIGPLQPYPPIVVPSSLPAPREIPAPVPCTSIARVPSSKTRTTSVTSTSASTTVPTKPLGKKRGRKPKNWDPTLEMAVELDPEEQEKQRKLALERNRIAASKSRRRKKEKVEGLEHAAQALCVTNTSLQSQCRSLLAEVHQLRAFMLAAHPQPSCTCRHINGYLARERDGGGLNAILFESQGTLDRDYGRVPKWGAEDDVFAGSEPLQGRPCPSGFPHSIPAMPDSMVMSGPPLNAVPIVPPGAPASASASSQGKGQDRAAPSAATRKGSKQKEQEETDEDEFSDEDEESDDEEESKEDKVALKSRRARVISVRKT